MTRFPDIYISVSLSSAPSLLAHYIQEGGVRLCGHPTHFGYSAMSLNLEHDLLSLVLYLPVIVLLDCLGANSSFSTWGSEMCAFVFLSKLVSFSTSLPDVCACVCV
jgi:hypothetical protein